MAVSTPAFEKSTGTKTNGTTITVGSFSPTGGDLLIAMVSARHASASITDITISSTFTGSWTHLGLVDTPGGDGYLQVATMTLAASPGSGTVTGTFDEESTAHSMIVFSVNGHNTSTAVKQSKSFTGTGTSTGTLSFDSAITAGNQGCGCIMDEGANDPSNGTNEVEIGAVAAGSANAGPYSDCQYSTDTDQNWGNLDDRAHAVWLLELDAAAAADDFIAAISTQSVFIHSQPATMASFSEEVPASIS